MRILRQADVSHPSKNFIFGPIAQLGERTVRIRKVVGSIPIRSTILRKITAKLAVIFRLTTIIPQTAIISDHFARTQAASLRWSPPVFLFIFDYGIATGGLSHGNNRFSCDTFKIITAVWAFAHTATIVSSTFFVLLLNVWLHYKKDRVFFKG